MRWRQVVRFIEHTYDTIKKWHTIILSVFGAGVVLVTWGPALWNWSPVRFIRAQYQVFWLTLITIVMIALVVLLVRLRRRFIGRFSDKFHCDLRINWDYPNTWRIAEDGTLLVTGSYDCGLTKVGALWENYTFTFEARIVDTCVGVVVRAQNHTNYHMLQINTKEGCIRPHLFVEVPVQIENQPHPQEEAQSEGGITVSRIPMLRHVEILDPVPLSGSLDDWFRVKVIVRGNSVALYIKKQSASQEELAFQEEAFLRIPTGKVGFRNDRQEKALVRDVRVTIQP